MRIYEAIGECYVGTAEMGYVQLAAGQLIGLSEENEKALKLGKFVEKAKDEKTGKEVLVGFKHLRLASKKQVEDAEGIDGMIVYPAPVQVKHTKPGVSHQMLPSMV